MEGGLSLIFVNSLLSYYETNCNGNYNFPHAAAPD